MFYSCCHLSWIFFLQKNEGLMYDTSNQDEALYSLYLPSQGDSETNETVKALLREKNPANEEGEESDKVRQD